MSNKDKKEMPAVLVRWLANLRSGKIKRCKGMYFDPDGRMCVMGVGKYSLEGKRNPDSPSDYQLFSLCDLLSVEDGMKYLVAASDLGVSFGVLADWLEELWLAGNNVRKIEAITSEIIREIGAQERRPI